uniref:Phospho-N-acetylmuramoyl-pentapeptide-transferase n=1 Tax=Candidatus Methanophagaceae archaeon ANME-1 ERB6 TaxID=2759912 RepID=A0A7G9YYI6_9EURY|nr:phospho-N-acetylmuramoyl-pentapeptide-transferase [Methanosarcinales archaeon ANME-1 ERB6]
MQMIEPVVVMILASFTIVMIVMPLLIKKLKKKGTVTTDYYKHDLRKIPTRGGVVILGVVFLMLGIATLIEHLPFSAVSMHISDVDWAVIIVAGLFGAFGLVDDFVDVGRPVKIFLLFIFSFRLIFEIGSTTVIIPFIGNVDFGMFYLFMIIPVYVMVSANLVNMHSGFNGLASGLSAIVLASLLLKFIIAGNEGIFTLGCILGATLGFLWYNRYPARIFLGNVGSLSIGAAIGAAIVVSGYVVAGFVMLIPHIINFLMYVYWRVMHRRHPEDNRWKIKKFGKVREDRTLEVPNCLTLKWVLPYYFRITEKQAVLAMYALTIPFCIAGLFIPY